MSLFPQGHSTVVKHLLEFGADPAVPDTHGRTPLDMAVGRGDGASIGALQVGAQQSFFHCVEAAPIDIRCS
eukprot:4137-Eustigmatos_ZCMA.PRE.1